MTMTEFIPFAQPFISQKVLTSVTECLQSGWLATGPKVRQFETALSEYFSCEQEKRYAITVNSATSGLHLALIACEIKSGDEVITTPLSFIATTHVIEHTGAKPVFVDIDENTHNIDVAQIEKFINSRTKAILIVHFAGLPVNIEQIYNLANKYNLRVIEDAAHAMGASYNSKKIGSFGDIQVFSFHPCKNMTSGEGGVIVTKDLILAQKLQKLRFFGLEKNAWQRHQDKIASVTDVAELGFKYNMSDIQAAIGLPQLQELQAMNTKRTKLAQIYIKELQDLYPYITLTKKPDNYSYEHAWHIFTIKINNLKISRDQFINKMQQNNIGVVHHYPAIHLFSYYSKRYNYNIGDFPKAEKVADSIASIPLFPHLTSVQQQKVIKNIRKIIKE